MIVGDVMHNKGNFKYVMLVILFIITILLCLTIYSIKNERKLTFVESAIKDTTLFIGKIFYAPFDFIKDKIDDIGRLSSIKNKYEKLKKDADKIDSYKQEIINLKQEIKDLKKITKIDNVLSLYSVINATVIVRDYNTWYNTLTIDKGDKNGISIGDAVTSDGKLIGTITKVSNFTSEVKLLSSDTLSNSISVELMVDNKEIYGLLTRYDLKTNLYTVEGISENITIEAGTKIVTSGLTGSLPRGIVIGEVDEMSKDNFDLTKILHVKPSADFTNIRYVSVLSGDDK